MQDTDNLEADATVQATTLRVDVLPPAGLTDRQGNDIDIPPHTFESAARSPLQAELQPAVEVSGYVTGFATTPYAPMATLPGENGGVPAAVQLRAPNTVMGTTAQTEDDGFYIGTVAPGLYELSVVPDDPAYPLYIEADVAIASSDPLDLDIGAGHPVWGQVLTEAGTPMPDVEVNLISSLGTAGPSTFTDDQGRYTLHAGPGSYHVVSSGRNNGRDPVLTSAEFELAVSGAQLDLSYGPLDLVSIGGRMVRSAGSGVGNATVRLTAEELTDYTGIDAGITIEIPADGSGNFDARVVSGTYRVELLPPSESALSPVTLGTIDLSVQVDIGSVVLPPLQTMVGTAVDQFGTPLMGATLRATEAGFEGRYFTATSDETGRFEFEVPAVDLDLLLTPPGDRPDLAATRQRRSVVGLDDDQELVAVEGQLVSGIVSWTDGERVQPLPFAIVQVFADDGAALGQVLTNADGEYSLQVDLAAYE